MDDYTSSMFGVDNYNHPPQATVSLAETNLMGPSTPESLSDVKDEGSDKKAAKKRKSWGQELPTPKTNLPPRYTWTTPASQ